MVYYFKFAVLFCLINVSLL